MDVLVRARLPTGWHLKTVRLDGQDVTDVPLRFETGIDVRGLTVVVTRRASTLAGVVRDVRGNLAVDATVILFPAEAALWTPSSRFVHTARPDTTGRFELTGLPASSGYRVIAVQGLEEDQAHDPEYLESIRDVAERLTLSEGERKLIELRLRPSVAAGLW